MEKNKALNAVSEELELCSHQLKHESIQELRGVAGVIVKNLEAQIENIRGNILDEQY